MLDSIIAVKAGDYIWRRIGESDFIILKAGYFEDNFVEIERRKYIC